MSYRSLALRHLRGLFENEGGITSGIRYYGVDVSPTRDVLLRSSSAPKLSPCSPELPPSPAWESLSSPSSSSLEEFPGKQSSRPARQFKCYKRSTPFNS